MKKLSPQTYRTVHNRANSAEAEITPLAAGPRHVISDCDRTEANRSHGIVIYDKQRNAVVSADPLWLAAETLLAYIEVKTKLTQDELEKSFEGAKKVDALRPFKKKFTLNESDNDAGAEDDQLRCFRTVFAFGSNLGANGWLDKEWARVKVAAATVNVPLASIDRILVLDRGMLIPPSETGTDQFLVSSVFQQWVINLVNIIARENSRREPWDWQMYAKQRTPGWRAL